jgi:hypothetical protein
MKISMKEFNDHLAGLAHADPAVRRRAINELAKYTGLPARQNPTLVPRPQVLVVLARDLPVELLDARRGHDRLWAGRGSAPV